MPPNEKLKILRTVITENLRVQKSGAGTIPYIDVTNAIDDVLARQNHVVFGRRGCGKTLLLQNASLKSTDRKTIYLNCEDFKNHSFPNVLIEILDAVFSEMEKHLSGWFGKKKHCKTLIQEIRLSLVNLRRSDDERSEKVVEKSSSDSMNKVSAGASKHTSQEQSLSIGKKGRYRHERQ